MNESREQKYGLEYHPTLQTQADLLNTVLPSQESMVLEETPSVPPAPANKRTRQRESSCNGTASYKKIKAQQHADPPTQDDADDESMSIHANAKQSDTAALTSRGITSSTIAATSEATLNSTAANNGSTSNSNDISSHGVTIQKLLKEYRMCSASGRRQDLFKEVKDCN